VSLEVVNALDTAFVMARDSRDYVDQMNVFLKGGGEIGIYITFYAFVNHKAMWDIKTRSSWETTIGTPFPGRDTPIIFLNMIMTPESLGNFTYGALGAAYGIPYQILQAGSYYAADFPGGGIVLANELIDQKNLLLGYLYGLGICGG